MLKLLLAGALAAYTFAPPLVAFALFAEFPEDGFGCRSCLHCGMIMPGWLQYAAASAVIGLLTYLGIKEIRK